MGSHRERVADLWDAYLEAWLEGDAALDVWLGSQDRAVARDLKRWQASYAGRGAGAVDLSCYPDPYTGDLRGSEVESRLVVLGLNPGVAYPSLQGRKGIWAERIRRSSYSRCFDRSPPDDPEWDAVHGGQSAYWRNLTSFGARWCGDDFSWRQVLNLELYPWHSASLTAGLNCPPDIVERYILQPLAEVSTEHVFAFGSNWDAVCRLLGFRVLRRYGEGGEPFPGVACPGWKVVLCTAPGLGKEIVVSWQRGYAGPLGEQRTATLRRIVASA